MNNCKLITIVMMCALWMNSTLAQNLTLKSNVLGSGGTRGQSASFILTNTVGEPAVGKGSSSSFIASYGFMSTAGGLTLGTIRGHIFNDLDGDSLQDEGEPALAGWKIYMSGDASDSTMSDSSGNYIFKGLGPGTYSVTESVKSGWNYSKPSPALYNIVLGYGEDKKEQDFGNYKYAFIDGHVFSDFNNNGAQDSSEIELSSWLIRLSRSVTQDSTLILTQVDSVLTDGSGNYSFSGISPGNFILSEDLLDVSWTQTFPLSPGTYALSVFSGDSIVDRTFGNYQALENSITLRTFKDNDGNLASTGDQSSKVWHMMLYKDSVSSQTLLVDTTASSFTIDSVFPGTYIAVEADTVGWVHKGIQINSGLKTTNANADTFIMNASDAKTVTFLNSWPNTVVIRKFKDTDGDFSTSNDRVPKKWSLKLYRGTINPQNLVASTTSAESLVITHGQGDLFQAIETDSAGWTHVGTIFDGTGAEGGESFVQFEMPVGGETHYIDFVNTHLAQITVSKFLDQDGDFRTTGDRTSKRWGMKLYKDSVSSSTIIDSVISGETFTSNNLPEGTYYAVESDSGFPWSHIATVLDEQNLAGGDNRITINLSGGQSRVARFINFNRNRPKIWTASVDCEWFKAGNWDPPGVPIPGDTIIVPDTAKCTLVIPPGAMLGTISIASGETVKVDAGSSFHVIGDVKIVGILAADPNDTSNIIVGGNWSVPGTFIPGQSTVQFVSDNTQTIESNGQAFYKIKIGGEIPGNAIYEKIKSKQRKPNKAAALATVKTVGNLLVESGIELLENVDAQGDTIFINNSFWKAVIGDGSPIRGTMQRVFAPSDTHQYRFQSNQTFIKFNNAAITPSNISVTVFPDTTPADFGGVWEIVPSTVDTVNNVVSATNITHFSKWAVGTIRPNSILPGNQKLTLDAPTVNRVYVIDPEGGGAFNADLSLGYDQSEVPSGVPEDSLTLYRLVGVVTSTSMSKGWNMVSVPVIVSDSMKTTLFPTASTPAYTYVPGSGYRAKDTLDNGVGYWVKYPSTQSLAIFGGQRLADTLDLVKGWQQVGSLSSSMTLDSVNFRTEPAGLRTANVYAYNGAYQAVTSLSPLKGYWVKMNSAGKLIMNSSGSIGKKGITLDPLNALNSLLIQDASGANQMLYFGEPKSGISLDAYELPPTPPLPVFSARYGSNRMVEFSENKQRKEIPISVSSPVYPLTVSWSVQSNTTPAYLRINGKKIFLDKNGSVQIKEPITQNGSGADVKSSLALLLGDEPLPKEFALDQNYPNPFNPNTVIRYSLPVNAHVTLTIYNVLGQKIKTLADQIQDAGYQSVEWNSSNDANNIVASGVYYYRIEATSVTDPNKTFTQVRKMVLLK